LHYKSFVLFCLYSPYFSDLHHGLPNSLPNGRQTGSNPYRLETSAPRLFLSSPTPVTRIDLLSHNAGFSSPSMFAGRIRITCHGSAMTRDMGMRSESCVMLIERTRADSTCTQGVNTTSEFHATGSSMSVQLFCSYMRRMKQLSKQRLAESQ
jgi:hypothetical protein